MASHLPRMLPWCSAIHTIFIPHVCLSHLNRRCSNRRIRILSCSPNGGSWALPAVVHRCRLSPCIWEVSGRDLFYMISIMESTRILYIKLLPRLTLRLRELVTLVSALWVELAASWAH